MSETEGEQPTSPVAAAAEASSATTVEDEHPGTPEGATVGDNQPAEGEHPVDQTPPQAEDQVTDKPAEAYHDGVTDPMHVEPGDPNERGNHGGDGTVWNG